MQNFSVPSYVLFLWSYVVISIHILMHFKKPLHELPLQINYLFMNYLFMNYKKAHVQLIHTLHLLAHVVLKKIRNL